MNKEKYTKTKPPKKKMISVLMAACTALSKPKNDLDLQQWQKIEFREQSLKEQDHVTNARGLM